MRITIGAQELEELTKDLDLLPEQISNATRNTIRQATTMAYEYVKQPNIAFPTSYKDTKKLPLRETKNKIYSGIVNTSEAFPYFEYGTGTGNSKGAQNGEWFVPVEKANLSQYYPITRDGRFYRVKPQRAQRMFQKTYHLIDRELKPLLEANLKKELKNG